MVKIVIVDRNDWFRRLTGEALLEYGIETVGGAGRPERVREHILRHGPEVLLWTVGLDDPAGEGVTRLLSGIPTELVPAVVALGEYQLPLATEQVGVCRALGKADGVPAMVLQINEAALERKRLVSVLSGSVKGSEALDVLTDALYLDRELAGTEYLRRGIELWLENGEMPARLYGRIGEEFSASASSVERSIRFAVSNVWRDSPVYNRMQIFGGEWDRVPTNVALMGALAGVLRGAEGE